MTTQGICRIIWVVSLIGIFGSLIAFGTRSTASAKPASFTSYSTSDKLIKVAYPENWKHSSTSSHDVLTTARFEADDNTYMVVVADLQGSLLADMSKSNSVMLQELSSKLGNNVPTELKKSPLETMHEMEKASFTRKFSGFVEEPAKKQMIGKSEAMVSEFVAKEPSVFSKGKLIGKRFTILGTDKMYTIYWVCLEKDSNELIPVFGKMLDSLVLGEGTN